MEVRIGEAKIVIKIGPKTFYFDLLKDADNNLIHEIGFIIKQNEFLAEHTIKNKISLLLFKYKPKHRSDIHEH